MFWFIETAQKESISRMSPHAFWKRTNPKLTSSPAKQTSQRIRVFLGFVGLQLYDLGGAEHGAVDTAAAQAGQ